jgi:stage II sporulation protein M
MSKSVMDSGVSKTGKKSIPLRRFYISSILAFFVPLFLGLIIGFYDRSFGEYAFNTSYGNLSFIKNLSSFELFLFIFVWNSLIGLLLVVSGLIVGLPTLFILVSNGLVIGAIMGWISSIFGVKLVLSGIIPHGVFEVPAVIIAGAYGLRVGASMMSRIRKNKEVLISDSLIEAIKVYFNRVLPLFLIAAIIESYVTPLIVFSVIK